MDMKELRVALVHDYLREYGGAERVLEALHEMYPEAPVYVAFVDKKALGIHWQRFKDWDIKESIAAKIPGIKKIYSPLRVLSAFFFEQFDFSRFDLVISSTNVYMAKAVKTKSPTKHICYCHTPPRSLYGFTTMTDWKKNLLIRVGGELINIWMRHLDAITAKRPDVIVANSQETRGRIQKFYHRDAEVIYPPVSLPETKGHSGGKKATEPYFLYVGRLAQSKHADLAVEACTLLDLPLKVVGKGGGEAYLKSIAGEKIEFLGAVDDLALAHLYQDARGLIFPAEDEDFGIVPVEAQIMGVPVIAHRSGGPKETIIEDKTGIFFDDLTVDSLVSAIRQFETLKFDSKVIKAQGNNFTSSIFKRRIRELVAKIMRT